MKDYKYILLGLLLIFAGWYFFIRRRIINVIGQYQVEPWQSRPLTEIDEIVVHHTAGDLDLNQIFDIHRKERGWPGISYHFVIDKAGKIYQVNELSSITYQAKNCNRDGIGVALIGNFEIEEPTKAQYSSLKYVLGYISRKLPDQVSVIPHYSCTATSCPGKNFDFEKIKRYALV